MNKEKMPQISVIIPVYNALNDVKILFRSLNENFNFSLGEILLINDYSDLETSNYLKTFCDNK